MFKSALNTHGAKLLLGLLVFVMAVPVFASDFHATDPAVAFIEDTVSRIVMDDLLTLRLPGQLCQGLSCVETDQLALCIDPSTPTEQAEEILRRLPTWLGEEGGRYVRADRWVNTVMDGNTGGIGTPITLTYSFLPDGVYIGGYAGEPGSNSILYSRMDALFGGDTAFWKQIFADCFNEWSEKIGIDYIEVSDDGASFPHSSGALGQRGDVRLAAHPIDGYYGILAYNFYPDHGEMVLDSAENWGNSNNDYIFFRNIVMHEHGHGHGLGHPTPNDHTKLMEAYLNQNFRGPQEDDIRGGCRNYGDPFENVDDDPAGANELGSFQGTVVVHDHSLDSQSDSDFFAFQVPVSSSLDVILDPLGQAMSLGAEGGAPPVTVYTDEMLDLQFTVWEDVAGTPTEILNINATGYGDNETITDYLLDPGSYFLEVHQAQGYDVQRYDLTLDIFYEDLTAVGEGGAPANGLGLAAFPNPFNPKTTVRFHAPEAGPVELAVYDTRGRRVLLIADRVSEAGWVEMSWDGRDESGEAMASGIYFLQARTGDARETIRGMLLK